MDWRAFVLGVCRVEVLARMAAAMAQGPLVVALWSDVLAAEGLVEPLFVELFVAGVPAESTRVQAVRPREVVLLHNSL